MTQEQFRAWAEKNMGAFYGAAKLYFGDSGDDYVADIYCQAYSKISHFDPSRGSLTTFVYWQAYGVKRDKTSRDKKRASLCQMVEYADEIFPSHEMSIDDLMLIDSIVPSLNTKQIETAHCLCVGDTLESIGERLNTSKQYAACLVKQVREKAREFAAA